MCPPTAPALLDLEVFFFVTVVKFDLDVRGLVRDFSKVVRTRKGRGEKAGTNRFGENNERILQGFSAVHKPRSGRMQTEPQHDLKKL